MRTSRGVFALLLAGVAACLGAVAYAAAPGGSGRPSPSAGQAAAAVPPPTITQHPNKMAVATTARFGFAAKRRKPRFQCRLDGRPWSSCSSPVSLTKLSTGAHSFSVRTLDGGRHSRATRFRWQILEPQDFSIQPQLSGLSALYPGAAPVPLPLTIANPNPVPILVTGLRATATADPLGCTSAENLELAASSASPTAPIRVPARGSVSLPAPGTSAPTIKLRDLPVNQDACQNARFPLAFSGEARG